MRQSLLMQILVDAENIGDIAQTGEIDTSLPVVCRHKVEQHDLVFREILHLFRDSPHDFVDDFVFQVFRNYAICHDFLFIHCEFQVSCREIIHFLARAVAAFGARVVASDEIDDILKFHWTFEHILNPYLFMHAVIILGRCQRERKFL